MKINAASASNNMYILRYSTHLGRIRHRRQMESDTQKCVFRTRPRHVSRFHAADGTGKVAQWFRLMKAKMGQDDTCAYARLQLIKT